MMTEESDMQKNEFAMESNLPKNDASTSTSGRSSTSSMDSTDNQTTPLELGLVIDALQNTLVEQEEVYSKPKISTQNSEQQNESISSKLPNTNEENINVSIVTEREPSNRSIKREEKIIVDYELDHGIAENSVLKQPSNRDNLSSTCSANLIDLDNIDIKTIKVNTLTPREQEKAGMYFDMYIERNNHLKVFLHNR